jgi:hypothetical protein
MDQNDVNGLDAVHAAQDLLDLSMRYDYANPTPTSDQRMGQLSTSGFGTDETSDGFLHSSVTALIGPMNLDPVQSAVGESEQPLSATTDNRIDKETATADQSYSNASSASLYFDETLPHTMSEFEPTSTFDPTLPDYFRNMPPFEAFLSGHATPRGIMDLNFDIDVGLTDLDLGLLDQYNFEVPFSARTPSSDAHGIEGQPPEADSMPVRTEAFKQSIWRYLPRRDKDFSAAEQSNLAFPDSDKDTHQRSHIPQRRAVAERLSRVSRDRLMALVLGTCSSENVKRIASAFPSVELLDGLIQYFLTSPALDVQSWFHLPTLSLSNLSPELLACIASAGAAWTPNISLRKLGFALHEAARIGQAKTFEEDNSAIRDLQHVRTLLLQLVIGMWSGVSRKMEIAESFLQALVTMIRRGARFRRSTWREETPSAEDQGPVLEGKWHEWVHQESYLRLVYQIFELDRQSSMALLKPPLISYSEMQLPLPSPDCK